MTYDDPDDDSPWVRANLGRFTATLLLGFVAGLGVGFTIITTAGGAA